MDVNYQGNGIQHFPNIASAQDCQERCQNNANCHYFSYKVAAKNCYLKNSNTPTASSSADWISGPKDCMSKLVNSNSFKLFHYQSCFMYCKSLTFFENQKNERMTRYFLNLQ